jgi:hypothetical protein
VWYVDANQLKGYGNTIMLCVTILVVGPVLGWLLSIWYRKSAPFSSEWGEWGKWGDSYNICENAHNLDENQNTIRCLFSSFSGHLIETISTAKGKRVISTY